MSEPLASMTGFGRASAQSDNYLVLVEIKSVNGRGLDVRSRLTPGFDVLEADIRRLISERVARGSVSVFLNVQRLAAEDELVVNERALNRVLAVIESLSKRLDARKPSIETILALKGVMEAKEPELGPDEEARLHAAILDCVRAAVGMLSDARCAEGERIGAILAQRIEEISTLADAARAHPARSREVILARLREQIAALIDADNSLSEDRLHQEAALLATKADIAEELDRFTAHVTAARELLRKGGPVGRKLDFLSQEFNREANTLCSKSNDVSLTAIGLDLKAAIDQLREQVQNLE
ncbi:YicC/YloC family endoribonuclease [Pelagibacterium sp. H642]|uniref:YicC/YloC family endoribonuclease n=1 Tax=Pelagibacterium sp. H642 TaxID=1881069 RepID=UPI0028169B6D|nr:YicC/YloC family endoribonuclease [Pelagibacterium sp. H642]WMT90921.1 YicC family protein [Pelagibacterium sp. H642]